MRQLDLALADYGPEASASLFLGYGLLSRIDATAFAALAVASAVYLIVDLSSPYRGYFRVSSFPIERVLADLNK